jgi:hypothetical protein
MNPKQATMKSFYTDPLSSKTKKLNINPEKG